MKDRELIARNIINIIDVKKCQYYTLFCGADMFDKLSEYLFDLCKANEEASEYAKKMLNENKTVIDKIVQGEDLSNDEFNSFMEIFRVFKRKYLM